MSVDYNPKQNEYKGLEHFRVWCQKVLPLVYDDSLSYYELLNKVVSYLNAVIENSDKMGEDVTHMFETFSLLLAWINSYFDNLDVQEEINNKLDNMSENGSLGLLIERLFGEYKEYINNIVDTQNEKVVNMNTYVTPEMFGAKGDGLTDDSSSFLQMINYIETNEIGIRAIKLKSKTYMLSSSILLDHIHDISIVGEKVSSFVDTNKFHTVLMFKGCDGIVLDGCYGNCFKNFNIIVDSDFTAINYRNSNNGINYSRCHSNTFECLSVNGANYGVKIESGTGYDMFRNIHFGTCKTGFYIGNTSTIDTVGANYITIDSCNFYYDDLTGESSYSVKNICIKECEYLTIKNCDFVDGVGVYLDVNSVVRFSTISNNIFYNCVRGLWCEGLMKNVEFDGNIYRLGGTNRSGHVIDKCYALYVKNETAVSSNIKVCDRVVIINADNISPLMFTMFKIRNLYFNINTPWEIEEYEGYPLDVTNTTVVNTNDVVGASVTVNIVANATKDVVYNGTCNLVKPIGYRVFNAINGNSEGLICEIVEDSKSPTLRITNSNNEQCSVVITPFYANYA